MGSWTEHERDQEEILISYQALFQQCSQSPEFNEEILKHFLEIRRSCLEDIGNAQQIIRQICPVSPYRTYSNAHIGDHPDGSLIYSSHSIGSPKFAKATIEQLGGDGRFLVDSSERIIVASLKSKIPKVSRFTPTISSDTVFMIPDDHPAVILHSNLLKIAEIAYRRGSCEFAYLLISEAVLEVVNELHEVSSIEK